MSFFRHKRSIVRWEKDRYGGVNLYGALRRDGLLTEAMSRSRVFLGGLVSTRARLRFADSFQNALQ